MEKKEIIIFSTATIVLSSLVCLIAHQLSNPGLSILSIFTPSIVALTMTAAATGKKGLMELFVKQTVKKMATKWLLLSLFGIPAVASLAILTSLNFDLSGFHLRTTQLLPQVVVIILIAIGEEYGWRGYLLPRLMKKTNVLYASIVLGLIWGLWHFPAYLIGAGVPQQMNFSVFLLWVVLGTLFMGWLYYYTKSVLTSILTHISANAAFNYLLILPEFTGSTNTFWLLIGYMSVLMAVVYAVGRKDLIKN
ncbi:MAG: CPBP family intramembrane glutamic endopeptidase [Imperialibacter sp.]|uniref:CPBP family intramembrane glutamic endopeptidase n=1 Tax=Imperialibacter sp. TaxID=2038411 RepID=UPI003A85B3B8